MHARVKIAFVDELRKLGVKLSERPTQIIKQRSESKVRRAMAKVRSHGKDTGSRVASMYAQYKTSAPSAEQVLRSRV